MADSPSTLTAWRVGGQLDPAWFDPDDLDADDLAGRTWDTVRVTATLSAAGGGAPVVDPTNGAHEYPRTVVVSLDRDALTGATSDGQWHTGILKATKATDPDDALQPTGLTWSILVEVDALQGSGERWTPVHTYVVEISADRDYVAEGETITVNGQVCVGVNALIDTPLTDPVSNAFADRVAEAIALDPGTVTTSAGAGDAGKLPLLGAQGRLSTTFSPVGAFGADLSVGTLTGTTVPVLSSTGTTATLPAATTSLAGVMTSTDKAKLDGIEAGATADQVASEVPVTPSGNLAASNVAAALTEHQADIDGINSTLTTATAKLATIETGATGDQSAAEVPVTPTGNLAASNTQAALVELQGDIDTTNSTATARRALTGAVFSYLKATGGAVNTAINTAFSAGHIALGDTIRTRAYWQGATTGGATYEVVASATGTDDGGYYISFTGFQLRAALGDTITVTQFGAATGTDNTARFQAAINYLGNLPTPGGHLHIPPGVWDLGATLTIPATGRYKITGPGAVLNQTANIHALEATGTWRDPQTVTQVLATTHTFPGASVTSPATRLTVTTPSAYPIGERVKLISADALTPDGHTALMGQVGVVGDRDSTYIYLTGVVESPASYVTSVQVARLPNLHVELEGVTFDATSGQTWTASQVIFTGLGSLRMRDCTGRNGYQKWLFLRGVVDFRIVDCHVENYPDDGTRYGYGATLEACEDGVVSRLTGSKLRHLFTTAVPPSGVGPSFARQGPTRNVVVSDGIGRGCSSAPWDTHQATRDVTFANCQSHDGAGGFSADGLGFSIRGRRILLDSPVSRGNRRGIYIFADSTTLTDEIRISNPDVTGGDGPALTVENTEATHSLTVDIDGGYLDCNADWTVGITCAGTVTVRQRGGLMACDPSGGFPQIVRGIAGGTYRYESSGTTFLSRASSVRIVGGAAGGSALLMDARIIGAFDRIAASSLAAATKSVDAVVDSAPTTGSTAALGETYR